MLNVVAPLTEEVVFRLLPDQVLEENAEGDLKGVVIQGLFAWAHGTRSPSGKRVIPIPQFLGGCFYWYLIRRKDVSHSVLAHAENNMAATISLFLENL